MSHDIYIVLPSLSPVGPVKGAIALANQLVIENNVIVVVLKPGPGVSSHIDPRVNILNLYECAQTTWTKVNFYRKVLKKSKKLKNAVSISMGFSADFLNLFCRDISLTCSSIRGNLPVNYKMDYGLSGLFLAYFHLFMLRRFTIVTTMSQQMSEQVEWFLGRKPDVIGNFIDETALRPLRLVPKTRSLQIKFVFVGSLSRRKCPTILVHSMKVLRDAGHDVFLDILGDGPLRGEVLSKVREYELTDNVKMHGHVDSPYEFVRAATVFVLPSMSEGISRASMESLFLGTPIVMRDVDANRTLVKDGFNGALFKDDVELPDAMMRAVNLKVDNYQDDFLPNCYRQVSQVRKFKYLLGV